MDLKKHTVKSYDKDIKSISDTIDDLLNLSIQSIDMVEELIKNPMEGFVKKITDHDYKINSLDNLVEKKVTSMLALRQPMAFDLRYVISSLKVSASLERIGDQAKSIVKKISSLEKQVIDTGTKTSLLQMLNIAKIMVRNAVFAFNNHDLEKAGEVLKQDDEIDKIYKDLFDSIDGLSFDRNQVKMIISILFIAKSFERLADHAADIAEITNYVVSGEITEKDSFAS